MKRSLLTAVGLIVLVAATAVLTVLWMNMRECSDQSPYTKGVRAYTLLHIARQQPVIFRGPHSVEDKEEFDRYRQMQVALLKSRKVLNAALDQPEIAKLSVVAAQSDPIVWLEKNIVADFPGGPEIFRIGFNAGTQEEAAKIVTAVRGSYLDNVVNKELFDRKAKVQRLRDVYYAYQDKLRGMKQQLRQIAHMGGGADKEILVLKQQIAQKALALAQDEAAALRSEVRRLKLEIESSAGDYRTAWPELTGPLCCFGPPGLPVNLAAAAMMHGDDKGSFVHHKLLLAKILKSHPELQETIEKHPRVKAHLELIAAMESQIRSVESAIPKGKPLPANVVQMRKDLDQEKKELETDRERVRGETCQQFLDKASNEPALASEKARAKLANLEKLQKLILEDVERLSKDGKALHGQTVDMEAIHEEIRRLEAFCQRFDEQIQEQEVNLLAPDRIHLFADTVVVR